MRAALRQSGLITTRAEPAAESVGSKWPALRSHEECQIANRTFVDDLGQRRQYRFLRCCASSVPSLLRHEANPSVVGEMLPAEAHEIAAADAEKQQQRQRQTRLGADRVPRFELCDLVNGPCVES